MHQISERIAENSHLIWGKKVCTELEHNERLSVVMPLMMVPWDLLTDFERRKDRFRAQEILKFFQYHGYRIFRLFLMVRLHSFVIHKFSMESNVIIPTVGFHLGIQRSMGMMILYLFRILESRSKIHVMGTQHNQNIH
jgi:hypothetical protein